MAIKKYDLETMEGRMAYAIDSKGQAEVARAIGVSTTQVYRITKGSKTTLENAIKIAQFTGFNMQWLAFGEGPQFSEQSLDQILDSEFIAIPYINTSDDKTPSVFSSLKYSKSFIADELKAEPKDLLAHKLSSEISSNKVHYAKGDELLLDRRKKSDNGFYLIKVNNNFLLVAVEFLLSGKVKVSSGSNLESIQELSQEEFSNLEIMGLVVSSTHMVQ